jgi:3-deoxy-D-manno-octulosonic-acid transferase
LAAQIYNISIHIYAFLIRLASNFNPKAAQMIIGRKGIFEKLKTDLAENKKPVAWFHCASLGEFEQGRPIIEAFAKKYPDYLILLTFFSPSGYKIRKNYDKAHIISYLPFDTFANANEFISIVNPKIAVFVKYEFWYNYLNLLKKNDVPTYLISANFRENQIFFKNYGGFFRGIMKSFTHIFVQNKGSEKLLQSIDYKQITVAGDTRFDRVFELSKSSKSLPIIEKFKGEKQLFVLGSAWAADFDFLLPFFNNEHFVIQVIIAPHEIKNEEIANWQSKLAAHGIKYSQLEANKNIGFDCKFLFIDNIGMLSSIYKYADYVWIGGAFGKGLHNILEAATFGNPIFFGDKNYTKFQEAVDLCKLKGAFSFGNHVEFEQKISEMYLNIKYLTATSEISRKFVENNIGATEKIMELINLKLPKN